MVQNTFTYVFAPTPEMFHILCFKYVNHKGGACVAQRCYKLVLEKFL